MTTPAYTPFDRNTPQGSDTPTVFAAEVLENLRSLQDSIISGRAEGFIMSRTQGTGPDMSRPKYVTWLHPTIFVGFRWKMVWGGTGNKFLNSCEWEWTNDNGSSWVSLGTAQVNTYDASNSITSTTNSGGVVTLIMELWTRLMQAGSMAVQNANDVNITGGLINGKPVSAYGSNGPAKQYNYRFNGGF